MARKANVFPSYLLHKPTGEARVRVAGQDHYLGEYGSEASRIAYGQLVANLAGGIAIDPIAKPKRGRTTTIGSERDPGPSVAEICLVFKKYAETHYVKNGKQTSEVSVINTVIRPLNELYGLLPAKDFGPLALKAVRSKMVESGWCRNSVNSGMNRIRRIFKYAWFAPQNLVHVL